MSQQDPHAAARAAPLDDAALATAVTRCWPHAQIVGHAPMLGGIGSLLDLIELSGTDAPRAAVLRRLLPEFGSDAAAARLEAAVHDQLSSDSVPVPRVYLSEPTGDLFGRPALLLEHMPGRALIADLATPAGAAALARALAAVGQRSGADIPGLPAVGAPGPMQDHLPMFGDVGARVDAGALRDAVKRMWPAATAREDLVHCDLHGGNVLWDGLDLTAILDWGFPASGSRFYDESYAVLDTSLAHGPQAGDQLRAACCALGGPRPSADEQRLWDGVALLTALPSPRPWAATYRTHGCVDASDEAVDARYVSLVEHYLKGTP